jgi:hypothetical protein
VQRVVHDDDQESVDGMMTADSVTDAELDELRRLSERPAPAPWRAMIEGRDHTSGDSFIMIGAEDDRDEDMHVSRDSGPASSADLDLIAAARNYLPCLLDEITKLRSQHDDL